MNKKRAAPNGEIIRVQHDRQHPYVVSSRALPEDDRLSWEARGLLWYLLAKPDNWQVMFTDLLRAGNAGRDKVRGMLRELEAIGYLGRVRAHNAQGHWQWVSTLYENPADRQPSPENPAMVQPSLAQPSTEKASLQESRIVLNTESNKQEPDPPATQKEEQIRAVMRAQIRRDRPNILPLGIDGIIGHWERSGDPDWLGWWNSRKASGIY